MADKRGTEGPFFYKGIFQYPSIQVGRLSDEDRRELRSQYRKLYQAMLLSHPNKRTARIQARKIFRPIMYAKAGMRNVR